MVDYAAVLTVIRPNSLWSMVNNDFASLVWDEGNVGVAPSQAECDEAWPTVQFDREYAQVERARHAAYITDADPLFFKWQRGTGTEGEWLAAVEAVKDAHPYPEPV